MFSFSKWIVDYGYILCQLCLWIVNYMLMLCGLCLWIMDYRFMICRLCPSFCQLYCILLTIVHARSTMNFLLSTMYVYDIINFFHIFGCVDYVIVFVDYQYIWLNNCRLCLLVYQLSLSFISKYSRLISFICQQFVSRKLVMASFWRI